MTNQSSPKFMIIAGEVSGDMHAAKLVAALRKQIPGASFFGTGGDRLKSQDVEILEDIKEMAVMGFSEVAKRYFFFKALFNRIIHEASVRRPNAVILVDYPGFNLRLAKKLHSAGIKTIYYICPQVWAWNRKRIPQMAASIDRLITIFPFEGKYFEGTGLKTDFVGHPLVEEAENALASRPETLPWTSSCRVALLPGSRKDEIDRILPLLLVTAESLRRTRPDASFIIAASSRTTAQYLQDKIDSEGNPAGITIVAENTREILRQAKAAIVASGTATVETALMGCPMVVVYRVSMITYLICRMLIRIKNIGMVNIIAGKTICPEFIQNDAKPDSIARALTPLLEDTPARKAMIDELANVKKSLGSNKVEELAANAICEEIGWTHNASKAD